MEINVVYQKKRKAFGRPLRLTDRHPFTTTDLPSDPSYLANYVERSPCQTGVQTTTEKSEHEVNTDSVSFMSTGILHVQGGWPKDVDSTDVEHTIRYRRKVEKDEEYMRAVKSMGETVEHTIKQNNAIDIYEAYFNSSTDNSASEPPSARALNVFKDPSTVKRTASCVSWYPDDGKKIAIAYSVLQFQQMDPATSLDSYIWDVESPATPDATLTPVSPIVCLKYNAKDPHTLVGGCYNGLVAFWDTRKGALPVDSSTIEKSHRDPVYNVSWVSSKSGSEFFSVSTDGQVLWWDTRKLSEPTETMLMDPDKTGKIVGGTVLDFESTMPTKFMIGTENGGILLCNKKSKNPNEKITHAYQNFHHGPLYALQRNPFFPKQFLSCGDWTVKLWSDDLKTPLFTTGYSSANMTDACWSPTRPSVFFTGRCDGTLEAWDFGMKNTGPCLRVKVGECAVESLRVQDRGGLMAATTRDGSCTVYQLNDALAKVQNNEKNAFSLLVDRENRREKTLENIARDKRLKGLQKQGGGVDESRLLDKMGSMMMDVSTDFTS